MRGDLHRGRGRAGRLRAALGRVESPAPRPSCRRGGRADRGHRRGLALVGGRARHSPGPHSELMRLSTRVLKGLTYRPTGAIVAAPTTSLPETVGGERNWDYRFAWIRDASLTLDALYIGACADEAEDFVSFMTSAAGGRVNDDMQQIMYGISGEHDLTERELPHLRGWRGSGRCASATAPGRRRSSTSTASCSTARALPASSSASCIPRSSATPRSSPIPRRAAGRRRRRHVGDARRGAPPRLLEGAVLDSARPRRQAGAGARRVREAPEQWAAERDEVREAILERGWSESARPTRSRSARTSWTPRRC